MEIGPVAGIHVVPVRRVAPLAEGPSAVFDLERLALPADDLWTGDGDKLGGGQDDQDEESSADVPEKANDPRRVNIFV
jgi:hypothetical protein